MKRTHMNTSRMNHRRESGVRGRIGILAAMVLTATLALGAAWAEESPSGLLEKGIYQEETAGNLPEAIKVYEKIAGDAQANRAFAAQALLRMGQCQLKLGRGDLANAAFDRLIREFPEQTALVEQAQTAKNNAGSALLPAPWKDGEEMTLDLVSPANVSVGTMVWAAKEATFDDKPVWVITSNIAVPVAGYKQTTNVTADVDTFAPILGETKNANGEFKAVYKPTEVLVTIKANGKDTAKTVERKGVAFDNEQALYVIRRLPLAPDYQGSFPIFPVQGGGVVVECRIEVTGVESIETGMGTFQCHRVKLGVYSGGERALEHTLWFTADEHRYLAKYDAAAMVMVLKSVATKEQAAVSPQFSSRIGYEMRLPVGWRFAGIKVPEAKEALSLVSPAGVEIEAHFFVSDRKAEWDSVRTAADDATAKRAMFLPGYQVDPDSWTNVPLSIETGLSWVARYENNGKPTVEVNVVAFHGNLAYDFLFRIPADGVAAAKPTLDFIVESFKFTEPTPATGASEATK